MSKRLNDANNAALVALSWGLDRLFRSEEQRRIEEALEKRKRIEEEIAADRQRIEEIGHDLAYGRPHLPMIIRRDNA